MKIVSLKRLGEIETSLINNYPDLEFYFFKNAVDIPTELKDELEILIGYDSGVDKNFINACPNLKWISWYATGVNNLPLDVIKERNIILTNTREYRLNKFQNLFYPSYLMTIRKCVHHMLIK